MTVTTNLPPTIVDAAVTAAQSWVVTALTTGHYCGYCTIADVKQEVIEIGNVPNSFDDSNVVARAIVKAALEIQSILNPVLTMPYAGSDAQILGRLNECNAKLAAAMVWERSMAGVAPGESTVATDLRNYVFQQLASLVHGEERWEAPFGDATARADQPAYTRAQLALSSPDPYVDPPVFQWDCFTYKKPTI